MENQIDTFLNQLMENLNESINNNINTTRNSTNTRNNTTNQNPLRYVNRQLDTITNLITLYNYNQIEYQRNIQTMLALLQLNHQSFRTRMSQQNVNTNPINRGNPTRINPNNHKIVVQGDKLLFNQYGVMLINKVKCPMVKSQLGQKFINWLLSNKGQKHINSYKVKYSEPGPLAGPLACGGR